MYAYDADLYKALCGKHNMYDIRISDEIKNFFSSLPEGFRKKKTAEEIKEFLIAMWADKKGRKKHNEVKLKETYLLIEQIKRLSDETYLGFVKWEDKLNTISSGTKKQRYAACFEDNTFYLTIVSYKNADNELKVNMDLQKEDMYGNVIACPRISYANLYNYIQKRGSIKKEKENPHIKKREAGESKKVIAINHGDFIVRTNLFRCYHKDHLVEEIIAILKVATPMGKVIEEKIPCAYCPECNCFFMLTSEYKRVSEKGILLCQLIDKEQYYQNGKLDKFNGASESLLMQNGYNVKANVGLTDIQRQIILENIMDSNILSQHRILSYLDAFIAQKINMPQYKEAVHKWQKDKEFVRTYDTKRKRVVEIKTIKK